MLIFDFLPTWKGCEEETVEEKKSRALRGAARTAAFTQRSGEGADALTQRPYRRYLDLTLSAWYDLFSLEQSLSYL